MNFRGIVLISAVAILTAACTSGGSLPSEPPTAASSQSSASAPSGATRIEVSLTDALKIEPSAISVPAGGPVTFVVTNTGGSDHEFFLGDEEEQAMHEQEMAEMGGMAHDEEMGIGVGPGQTKELTVTFPEPRSTLAGCHVAGHYAGGMKATITVTE
jgi:uncharacterized cupredoxin-like copper-binding protein